MNIPANINSTCPHLVEFHMTSIIFFLHFSIFSVCDGYLIAEQKRRKNSGRLRFWESVLGGGTEKVRAVFKVFLMRNFLLERVSLHTGAESHRPREAPLAKQFVMTPTLKCQGLERLPLRTLKAKDTTDLPLLIRSS